MWHSVTMVNTSCRGPASAPCLGGQRAGSILLGTGHPASPVAAWGWVLGWDALGHCPSGQGPQLGHSGTLPQCHQCLTDPWCRRLPHSHRAMQILRCPAQLQLLEETLRKSLPTTLPVQGP